MGVDLEIEILRRIKTGKEKEEEMVLIKVGSGESRRKMLQNKRLLRGKNMD